MNYAIVVSAYYPSIGGVQNVTKNLAEGLVERGHDVTVVTSYKGCSEKSHQELINNVKIVRYDVVIKKGFPHGEISKLKEYIQQTGDEYDVIVLVSFDSALVMPLLPIVWDFRGKKVLYMHNIIDLNLSVHHLKEGHIGYRLWNICRMRYLLKSRSRYLQKFDLTIHIDKDVAYQYFTTHNIGTNVVLSNFAEDVFFSNTPCEDLSESSDRYIINVANYLHTKNQELLVKAFFESKLSQRLIIIGSQRNEYYEKVNSLVHQLKKTYPQKKVEMYVSHPRSETVELIKNAYLFVLTSTMEGMPIALIESVSAGVPFISSNVGSISDIVGGVVIDEMNPQAFSIMIDRLFSDKHEYERLKNQGIEYSKVHYTRKAYLDKFEKYVSEL